MFHLNVVYRRRTRRRTTNVERTHRKLRTRFTDGLRCNYANTFANVDLMTTRKIAAITLGADAVGGFTGNCTAHPHFVDAQFFQLINPGFVDHRTSRDQYRFTIDIQYILGNDTTQYPCTQRFNNVTTFDDGGEVQTCIRATIYIGDHHVLGNIHKASSQVTGVGGLKRRVGKTFPCTVGGDEVLVYSQAFTEVCGNRILDDRTIRTGHQATHTCKLTNLGR